MKARLLCDIGKGTVSIVFVEAIAGAQRRPSHASAAEQKNIHPAVIVVVKKCAATSDCLENVVIAVGVSINHGMGQASCAGDIDKVRIKRASGRQRFRLWLYRARSYTLTQQF